MHEFFATTTRTLRRDAPPMRLFEKAKRFGIWNPSDIDFSQDARDWTRLNDQERDVILRLTAMFQAGEEAVTLDLLPLVMAVAREGRLEEELYLTTFLFEEAKHTDFFRRFLDEVTGGPQDLSRFHGNSYRALFYQALPQAMNSLLGQATLQAQVRASVTYNIVVEGILAETGYHAYLSALERNGLMPGQCQGIRLLKQDESRHIAYGIFLISRCLALEPGLWSTVEDTVNALLPSALGVITETFAAYDVVPFGLVESEFVDYALAQFNKRMDRLDRARVLGLDELHGWSGAGAEEASDG